MSVNCALLIASLGVAFGFLLVFIGKKVCDMAIKANVARKYTSLIFTPEQKDAIQKTSEDSIKWLSERAKEVEIISRDGLKLKGYEVRNSNNSDVWVIAVHGYMGRGSDMVEYAKKFMEYGYNCLIVDLRAHGLSEGEYIGMGWLDHFDLEIWIDKIIEENKNCNIILYGISMGAATVTMLTGERISEQVKMCIADCGYTSVWDEFKVHLKKIFHIPTFPLLYVGSFISKIYAGYSFKEGSSIKQVKKSKTPTLFIHGTRDKFVPFKMLDQIYKNAQCKKEKIEIEDAGHAESCHTNPEKYWQEIEQFIEKNIN